MNVIRQVSIQMNVIRQVSIQISEQDFNLTRKRFLRLSSSRGKDIDHFRRLETDSIGMGRSLLSS